MMEKVGSLTFLTRASCGSLQCFGCWFFQSPAAEKSFHNGCFCSWKKWISSESPSKNFQDTFTPLSRPISSLARVILVSVFQTFCLFSSSHNTQPASPFPLPAAAHQTLPSARVGIRIAFCTLLQIDISWSLISRGGEGEEGGDNWYIPSDGVI